MASHHVVVGLVLCTIVTPLSAQEPATPSKDNAPAIAPTTIPPATAYESRPVPATQGYSPHGPTTVAIPPDTEQHVSVVLQIDGLGESTPYGLVQRSDVQAVASLLSSTAVVDAALAKSLKLTPKQRQESVIVAAAPAGGRFTRLDVALRKAEKPWQPDAAQQLSKALCDQIKSAYQESANVTAEKLKADSKDLERHRDEATEKLQALRQKMQMLQVEIDGRPYEGGDLRWPKNCGFRRGRHNNP